MAGVLVSCDACGAIATADDIIGLSPGNTASVTFSSAWTRCPQCGERARILDGTFRFQDHLVQVLAAPSWTLERLLELRAALESLQREPSDAAAKQVGEVAPEVGQILRVGIFKGWTRSDAIAFVAALIGLINLILQAGAEGRYDVPTGPGTAEPDRRAARGRSRRASRAASSNARADSTTSIRPTQPSDAAASSAVTTAVNWACVTSPSVAQTSHPVEADATAS